MKLFKFLILPILFMGCSQKTISYNKLDKLKSSSSTKDCSDLITKLNLSCNECYYKERELRGATSKTKMIYMNLEKRGLIYSDTNPNIMDLIFFDNTYDANRDGILNDELTHIGVVTSLDNNRVGFLHNIRGKNIDGYIDLAQKDNQRTNSYIRVCKQKEKKLDCLTSNNFRAYGRLEKRE